MTATLNLLPLGTLKPEEDSLEQFFANLTGEAKTQTASTMVPSGDTAVIRLLIDRLRASQSAPDLMQTEIKFVGISPQEVPADESVVSTLAIAAHDGAFHREAGLVSAHMMNILRFMFAIWTKSVPVPDADVLIFVGNDIVTPAQPFCISAQRLRGGTQRDGKYWHLEIPPPSLRLDSLEGVLLLFEEAQQGEVF